MLARRWATWVMLAAAALPTCVWSQDAVPARAGVASSSVSSVLGRAEEAEPQPMSLLRRQLERIPLSLTPIASALIPGLGQARIGKERFVGYLALEAYLWLQYAKNRDEGLSNAIAYRTIARDVARRNYPGTHPDTAWQYYEKLEKYLDSGAYTMANAGATVPETDTLTYNGAQWVLARLTYGIPLSEPAAASFPRYAQALAYYESRAIPLAYGWSWDNAQLEKDLYVRAIGRSNDSYRRATGDLIALIANHVLSTIDAFAGVRLMQSKDGNLRVRTSLSIQ